MSKRVVLYRHKKPIESNVILDYNNCKILYVSMNKTLATP